MRKYSTVEKIVEECPGAKAYILQAPAGPSFLWNVKDPVPAGRFVLLGIID